MPQAIDLTVKNGAATAVDKTFSLVTPASGDGGIAQWALKEGSISAVFPTFTASAGKTGNKSRKLTMRLAVPSSYTDGVTGLTNVGSGLLCTWTVSIPQDFPEAMKADATAFIVNLTQHPLVKAMIRDAYSAT